MNKLTPLHVRVRLRKRFLFLQACLKWECIHAQMMQGACEALAQE